MIHSIPFDVLEPALFIQLNGFCYGRDSTFGCPPYPFWPREKRKRKKKWLWLPVHATITVKLVINKDTISFSPYSCAGNVMSQFNSFFPF